LISLLEPIKFENFIEIENVPIQWLPFIQLYDPYLTQFPIVYIHLIKDNTRVYGFPQFFSVKQSGKFFTMNISFLSNVDLSKNSSLKDAIKSELEKRIGIKDKIDLNTLIRCCNNNKKYENFVKDLWKYVSKTYGGFLPYVVMNEVYSIVRFLTALASPSGRKSEMQMLYDFISFYGEEVEIQESWNHFKFYLIPTYDEVLNRKLDDFPKFNSLVQSMEKFAKMFYTGTIKFGAKSMKILKEGLPSKDEEWRKLTSKLVSNGKITDNDKANLDFLVDAFNRFPLRAICFIGTIYNTNSSNDFRKWTKKDFIQVYTEEDTKGFSPKAVGCFLQQGFGNFDAIPIDIWVKTFYQKVFDIKDDKEFLNTFSEIGKLERLIWLVSQGRKINLGIFYDILWCIKFGTPDDELRGSNPLSCYECKLRATCIGYNSVKDRLVFVQEIKELPVRDYACNFVVGTQNKVPKIVFEKRKDKWVLIDEYSGYIIHNQKTSFVGKKVKVEEFIKDLPAFSR